MSHTWKFYVGLNFLDYEFKKLTFRSFLAAAREAVAQP